MIRDGERSCSAGAVRLREITPADAPLLYALRMHPSARWVFRSTAEVPYAVHEAFLAAYFADENRDEWYVIEHQGVPVGAIALYGLTPDGREAEWGRFVIQPESRGLGLGSAALRLLIARARRRGLERLHCEVLVDNRAALELYLRLGFRERGRAVHGDREFAALALVLQGGP